MESNDRCRIFNAWGKRFASIHVVQDIRWAFLGCIDGHRVLRHGGRYGGGFSKGVIGMIGEDRS